MIDKAKQTLDDLKHAVDLLDATDDVQTFRVICVAAVALSRGVGHALRKDADDRVVAVSNSLFMQWREDKEGIFSRFVEPYRNRILKDAEFDLNFDIPFAVFVEEDAVDLYGNDLLYVPFASSEYGDLDVRDLLHDSIDWWEKQLQLIEDLVSRQLME